MGHRRDAVATFHQVVVVTRSSTRAHGYICSAWGQEREPFAGLPHDHSGAVERWRGKRTRSVTQQAVVALLSGLQRGRVQVPGEQKQVWAEDWLLADYWLVAVAGDWWLTFDRGLRANR